MELNKQNEKLLQELLKKYKQGIISGLYPGNNITFTPTGCRDKIISSTSSGTGGGIQSIQEGDNITVDDTDPLNPIVSVQDITLSGEVTGSTSLSAIDKTAITNKTTETIVGTDYVLFGDTSDSNNLKKGLVSDIVALSGGGSLSSLTAATASNTINNVANAQEWQWNSLTSGIGLKLSSTSTGATSNTQTIMSINQSGANANANQSTYGLKISNSKTGVSNINYGLDVSCTGAPTNGNVAINADGRVYISNGSLQFRTTGYGIYFAENSFGNNIINFAAPAVNSLQINSGANINLNAVNGRGVSFGEPNERFYNFSTVTGVRSVFLMGAELIAGTYYSFATGTCGIERNGASLRLSANVTGGGGATYTPNDLLTVYGTNSNVGIGTTTPVASAKLEVSSTTSGFLPPRMTATQASAISSPAKGLILYSTDTDGTFTSAGLWMYNGTIWKLILAE